MTKISEQLQTDALRFLDQVVSDAREEGHQIAKAEYDKQVSSLSSEHNEKVKEAYDSGLLDGYNKHKAETEASGHDVEPVVPEPAPIDNDPVHEGYSREKVLEELLAIKGGKSYVFGIIDVAGNVYADASEWILASRPEVLGIGYTDGTHHLCMHPKRVAAAPFGGNGIKFSGVHTTKKQWAKDTTATENAAWDDYSGANNTEGLMEGCDDSIAAKCTDYMPACAELRVYCKYYNEVDVLLKAVGGDVLKVQNGAQLLWSSTCRDENNAWAVRFMKQGDAQPAYRAKTSSTPTRQFIEL